MSQVLKDQVGLSSFAIAQLANLDFNTIKRKILHVNINMYEFP